MTSAAEAIVRDINAKAINVRHSSGIKEGVRLTGSAQHTRARRGVHATPRTAGRSDRGGEPVNRHWGEPAHTGHTRDTRAHKGTRITQTNLSQPHPNPHTTAHNPEPAGDADGVHVLGEFSIQEKGIFDTRHDTGVA